jgi:hypothetical protein
MTTGDTLDDVLMPCVVRLDPTGKPVTLVEIGREGDEVVVRTVDVGGKTAQQRLSRHQWSAVEHLGPGTAPGSKRRARRAVGRSTSSQMMVPRVVVRRARRRSVGAAVAVSLVVGAAGGFAVGLLVSDGGDGADAVTNASTLPLRFGDGFEGAGSIEGRALEGRPDLQWSVVRGKAVLTGDGQLELEPDGAGPALAVVSDGGRIESLALTVETSVKDAGLVYRMVDDRNYWELISRPDFGTWLLRKVVDGVATQVADSGFSGGTKVEVVFVGGTTQLWVDGLLRSTIRDTTHAAAETFGVVSPSGDDTVLVDSVEANGL